MKCYIREFFENLSREVKVHYNVTRIMSTLLDDRYTFLLGLSVYCLEWENSGTELYRKLNHTFYA